MRTRAAQLRCRLEYVSSTHKSSLTWLMAISSKTLTSPGTSSNLKTLGSDSRFSSFSSGGSSDGEISSVSPPITSATGLWSAFARKDSGSSSESPPPSCRTNGTTTWRTDSHELWSMNVNENWRYPGISYISPHPPWPTISFLLLWPLTSQDYQGFPGVAVGQESVSGPEGVINNVGLNWPLWRKRQFPLLIQRMVGPSVLRRSSIQVLTGPNAATTSFTCSPILWTLREHTVRWSNFDSWDPKMGVFLQSTEATPCGHFDPHFKNLYLARKWV